ncbi:hypothetical protein OAL55_05120, partial [Verrucomicrobiales bacterium]|nr:hypothetical protein [Verrucomicrobiales bacterium]
MKGPSLFFGFDAGLLAGASVLGQFSATGCAGLPVSEGFEGGVISRMPSEGAGAAGFWIGGAGAGVSTFVIGAGKGLGTGAGAGTTAGASPSTRALLIKIRS